MQKRRTCRHAAMISLLVVLTLFSFVSAQNKASSNSGQQPVITESPNLITLHLKLSNNRTITVTQYDGEMITTGPANDLLGITPRLLDTGSVALDFFHITEFTKAGLVVGKNVANIGSMELNNNLPQSTPINRIFSIELVNISKGGKDVEMNLRDYCCVTCNNEQTCARCVEMYCGQCGCQ